MRPWISESISLVSRLFCGGLFLYASLDKVWDPASFAQATAAYDLAPLWSVNAGSVIIAWLELTIALCLLLGVLTRPAVVWFTRLIVFFVALQLYAEFTGATHGCGCFPGEDTGVAGWKTALRDLIFLLPALWLLWRPGRWLALDTWLGRDQGLTCRLPGSPEARF